MPRHSLAIEAQMPPIYISNNYFDCGIGATTRSSIAGVATRLVVYPFVPQLNVTVNLWAIDVVTAASSALARMVIYDSDATNSLPGTRLLQSADMDCSTAGVKSENINFNFVAGHLYWVGVHNSSTATLRGIPVSDSRPLSVLSTSSNAVNNAYRQDITYGTSSPNPFGTATITAQILPQVKFRVA
jgi:hypothetical protein